MVARAGLSLPFEFLGRAMLQGSSALTTTHGGEEHSTQEVYVDLSLSVSVCFSFRMEKAWREPWGRNKPGVLLPYIYTYGLGIICVSEAPGTVPGTVAVCPVEASA